MARLALEPPLDDVPFVLDLVDVDSQKWTELADRSAGFMRWIYRREARHLGAFEAVAATRASATVVVNQREADIVGRLAPTANIHVAGCGVDFEALRSSSSALREARVVFCGVLNYAPNDDAALWLVRHIWPLVRDRRSEARLTIVGANPSRRLMSACEADRTIELAGTVPDVRPYLWRSAVSVAPLRVARGIQTKVLEALAAGLPPVVTSPVAEGLPVSVRRACAVADKPEPFAAAICRLLDLGDQERRAMVARAALEELDWHRSLAPLWDVLQGAATRPVPALSLVAV
jgi:glycosyltransferase involved in cell wall biosynthesis